LETFKQHSIS